MKIKMDKASKQVRKAGNKAKMMAGSKVGTSSLAKKDGGMKRAGRGAYRTKNVNKL